MKVIISYFLEKIEELTNSKSVKKFKVSRVRLG